MRKDASQYAEVHSRDFEHKRGDLRGNRRRSFNLRTGGGGIAPSFFLCFVLQIEYICNMRMKRNYQLSKSMTLRLTEEEKDWIRTNSLQGFSSDGEFVREILAFYREYIVKQELEIDRVRRITMPQ